MIPRSRRDTGSGSVLVLGVGALLVVATVAVGAAGQVVAARHRAEASADLAALAAASMALTEGPAAACRQAARVVAAQTGTLDACRVDGDGSVSVVVRASVLRSAGALAPLLGPVTGRARAGPSVP